MAVRFGNKISSELLKNFNRFFQTKPEISSTATSNTITSTEANTSPPTKSLNIPLRISDSPYTVCKTEKPSTTFSVVDYNIGNKFSYLQPAKLPEVIADRVQKYHQENILKIKDGALNIRHPCNEFNNEDSHAFVKVPTVIRPFPDSYRASNSYPLCNHENAFKTKSTKLCNFKHNIMTMPLNVRYYSSKKKEPKCKQKKECKQQTKCPRMVLRDCECRTVEVCAHPYRGPPCKKQIAPYPSYSESCAQQLEQDPSECIQCPWRRCPIDTKDKGRHYHTSTQITANRLFHSSTSKSNLPPLNMPLENFANLILNNNMECDVTKKPCQRPPGKCPPKAEKKEKKEKCIPPPKKKCSLDSNWSEAYGIWMDKQDVLSHPLMSNNCPNLDLKDEGTEKFPYDKREASYKHKRQRKCHIKKDRWPGCQPKKRKFHIHDCPPNPCKHPKETDSLVQEVFYYMDRNCPSKEKHPHYPDVDKSINNKYHPKPCCNERSSKPFPKKYRKKKIKPRVYEPVKVDYDNIEL